MADADGATPTTARPRCSTASTELPPAAPPAARRRRHARARGRRQGSAALVDAVFLEAFADGEPARCPTRRRSTLPTGERLAFSTDSFVVKPLRFPGGSIGHLAVHGTVNDLAVQGAAARVALGRLRDRRGLPGRRAPRASWPTWPRRRGAAGVQIVTGDTKVVGRGAADGLFITTRRRRRDPARAATLGPAARAGRATACSCRARSPITAWR